MSYKEKRKLITLICSCGTVYEKPESEYKRNQDLGRRSFCSRKCVGKNSNSHLDIYKNSENFKDKRKNDEFTGLRGHLNRAKNRHKEVNLTLEDLKSVWDSQEGKCVYSKVNLEIPKNRGINNPIYTSSLDRIDSNKGYTKDNIQFISIAMNHMKNSMTDIEMRELINILKNI